MQVSNTQFPLQLHGLYAGRIDLPDFSICLRTASAAGVMEDLDLFFFPFLFF